MRSSKKLCWGLKNSVALLVAVLLLAVLLVGPASAEVQDLVLDSSKTEVLFVLGATGHQIHGRLVLTKGEIRFDSATGSASGIVEIDARTAETGNEKRDRKMHAQILLSDKFSSVVFVPKRIEGEVASSGESEFKLHGTITLLGNEHEATLETKATIVDGSVQAHATFVVPYVAWGLKDPSVLVLRVAKSVDVTIEAVGQIVTPNP